MDALDQLLQRYPDLSPFSLERHDDYRRWREAKLTGYPLSLEALVVEVGDATQLTAAEKEALLARVRKTNMALYVGDKAGGADKEIPRRLGLQFGLLHLDSNYLADDDGITALTVNPEGEHPRYIPYTDRPINWHTDGYYNTSQRQIRGLILHCVQPAAQGGENALLDPEIVYLHLRDENPDYIRALMAADAMTIPEGTDSEGGHRGAATGPVFSVHPESGSLHMRYTARKRNIIWKDDPLTAEAIHFLERLLVTLPYVVRGQLAAGMGLLCNNVLHTREAFADGSGASQRLLFRARYFDRIAGTGMAGGLAGCA